MIINSFKFEGTIGDSFIVLCKVWKLTKKGSVIIYHYTQYEYFRPLVKEILTINKNIRIIQLDSKEAFVDLPLQELNGFFEASDMLDIEPHPLIGFECDLSKFVLPSRYNVVCLRSGRPDQNHRIIPFDFLDQDINDNTIFIGTNCKHHNSKGTNLIDKTTLFEAMCILAGATRFTGFQGFFSFLSMSMKILTSIYVHTDSDIHAINVRILPEWSHYINKVYQI